MRCKVEKKGGKLMTLYSRLKVNISPHCHTILAICQQILHQHLDTTLCLSCSNLVIGLLLTVFRCLYTRIQAICINYTLLHGDSNSNWTMVHPQWFACRQQGKYVNFLFIIKAKAASKFHVKNWPCVQISTFCCHSK